jgi:hypothetical protein
MSDSEDSELDAILYLHYANALHGGSSENDAHDEQAADGKMSIPMFNLKLTGDMEI